MLNQVPATNFHQNQPSQRVWYPVACIADPNTSVGIDSDLILVTFY